MCPFYCEEGLCSCFMVKPLFKTYTLFKDDHQFVNILKRWFKPKALIGIPLNFKVKPSSAGIIGVHIDNLISTCCLMHLTTYYPCDRRGVFRWMNKDFRSNNHIFSDFWFCANNINCYVNRCKKKWFWLGQILVDEGWNQPWHAEVFALEDDGFQQQQFQVMSPHHHWRTFPNLSIPLSHFQRQFIVICQRHYLST